MAAALPLEALLLLHDDVSCAAAANFNDLTERLSS
jgi:hypothetical protein